MHIQFDTHIYIYIYIYPYIYIYIYIYIYTYSHKYVMITPIVAHDVHFVVQQQNKHKIYLT